ncbi:MAG: hypothetical protein JNL74_20350 [Fibrobacteres bacterium]|nr:hypothetical protein [Fibrobacterota bacterium]
MRTFASKIISEALKNGNSHAGKAMQLWKTAAMVINKGKKLSTFANPNLPLLAVGLILEIGLPLIQKYGSR